MQKIQFCGGRKYFLSTDAPRNPKAVVVSLGNISAT